MTCWGKPASSRRLLIRAGRRPVHRLFDREDDMRRCVRYGILVGACALIAGIICVGFSFYEMATEGIVDCYAQEWVAEMVIDHMDRNDGAWPKSWDDLIESYEILAGRMGQPWSFDELRHRCAIDFDAQPQQLASGTIDGEKPPFRVIWLRNGKKRHWAGLEPNRMILDYLARRTARPDDYRPPKRPVPEEGAARRALLKLGARWELSKEGYVTTVHLSSPVGQSRFTDDALTHLKELRKLRGLDLGYSEITDQGMQHIQPLSELRWIYLYGTNVTDDGLKCLHSLTNLETLVLADDNFSDRCLEHLATLPNLKLLNLNGCRITDDSIPLLQQHTALETLMLYDTDISPQGLAELKRALPDCKIEHQAAAGTPTSITTRFGHIGCEVVDP